MNRVYMPQRGASGRMLRDLARHFAREGWQVSVITSGEKAGVTLDGAVKVIRVKGAEKPSNIIGYIWVWLKMLFCGLRMPRTDLLVTMTDPPLLVIAGHILCRIKKNRHMHWCQDLYPDLLPSFGVRLPKFLLKGLKKFSRHCMRKADKIIVVGRCMARRLSSDQFDARQISVIPNWPDAELVYDEPSPEDKNDSNGYNSGEALYRTNEEQKKYGPKFRVLYAGNIGYAHPIDTIMAAAERLNNEQDDIEFVFVGDGPNYDEIARRRSSLHLDNVRLLPYQPASRLRDLMESGDVHLISMKEDIAGMVVPSKLYSALAAKRPCVLVGPTYSEAAKVINDYQAGCVIGQGRVDVLVEEIRQMRFNSDHWYKAYEGAMQASNVFLPQESMNAWIERALFVIKEDIGGS